MAVDSGRTGVDLAAQLIARHAGSLTRRVHPRVLREAVAVTAGRGALPVASDAVEALAAVELVLAAGP